MNLLEIARATIIIRSMMDGEEECEYCQHPKRLNGEWAMVWPCPKCKKGGEG